MLIDGRMSCASLTLRTGLSVWSAASAVLISGPIGRQRGPNWRGAHEIHQATPSLIAMPPRGFEKNGQLVISLHLRSNWLSGRGPK
jgi:hypothetical protein